MKLSTCCRIPCRPLTDWGSTEQSALTVASWLPHGGSEVSLHWDACALDAGNHHAVFSCAVWILALGRMRARCRKPSCGFLPCAVWVLAGTRSRSRHAGNCLRLLYSCAVWILAPGRSRARGTQENLYSLSMLCLLRGAVGIFVTRIIHDDEQRSEVLWGVHGIEDIGVIGIQISQWPAVRPHLIFVLVNGVMSGRPYPPVSKLAHILNHVVSHLYTCCNKHGLVTRATGTPPRPPRVT